MKHTTATDNRRMAVTILGRIVSVGMTDLARGINHAGDAAASWYVGRALRGIGGDTRKARPRWIGAGIVAMAFTGLLPGCGGGGERQDVDEKEATYPVKIVTSEFPTRQRLAQTTNLKIAVRNSGDKAIPNLAVTISLAGRAGRSSMGPFTIRVNDPRLAVPDRPVWILENGFPKLAGSKGPAGAQTANQKTFAFGALEGGETVSAIWRVTPVDSGDFTLRYRVDAGLYGNAIAKTPDGNPPVGSFAVQISDTPPQTRVDEQGNVVPISPGGVTDLGGAPSSSG